MAPKRRSQGGEPKPKAAKKSDLPALPPDVKNTPVSKLIQEWVSFGCTQFHAFKACFPNSLNQTVFSCHVCGCVSCRWLDKGECA